VSVIACGDQNKLRSKAPRHRYQHLIIYPQVFIVATPCMQRNIYICSLTISISGFLDTTAPGVPRALVCREIENMGIIVEGVLCPIAVMDIEVSDENAFQIVVSYRIPGSDSDVVEQTETFGCPASGVMSRRPDQGEGALYIPCHHCFNRLDEATGGIQSHIIGGRRDHRIRVEKAAASLRE
jgi:hypothetical protein